MIGEQFCRMWDFYLASAELGLLNGSNFVFQILISTRREERRLLSSMKRVRSFAIYTSLARWLARPAGFG